MIKILSFLIFLFFIPGNINALENFDECSVLKNKLLQKHNIYSLDEPISNQSNRDQKFITEYSSFFTATGGLIFERQQDLLYNIDYANQSIYMRTLDGNLILESYHPNIVFENEASPSPNSVISAINGVNVNEIDDDEINEIINNAYSDDGNIFITVKSENNTEEYFQFNVLKEWITGFAIENSVYEISNINSSQSTFDIRLREEIYWKQFGIQEIGREIMEESNVPIEKLKEGMIDGVTPGFFCIFEVNEWKEMNMFLPDISIQNLLETNIINQEIIFSWTYDYYFDESGMPIIIEDSSYYDLQLNIDAIYKLKSDFDYSAFPFDSQIFTIEYGVNKITNYNPLLFSPFDNLITQSLSNTNIYEWDIVDFSTSKPTNIIFGSETLGHNINIVAERQYFYYLIKIYLPILIVLSISLSVLFINPIQLESRLTASVVCFLALIAYTYIIDNDVPKLSYLTIMDYAILISYFFAAVPIIQSIATHSISENSQDRSIKFNNNSKLVIPILYALSIIVMSFMIISASENVIGALKP